MGLRDSQPPTEISAIRADEISNFHRVDPSLYRGARPRESEEVYLKLAQLGIRSILNLERTPEAAAEKALVDRANRRLRSEGKAILDFIPFPMGGSLQTFVTGWPHARVQELFRKIKDAPKPVFVHCHYGKDRTGAVVILYRLKLKEEKSFEEAYREARGLGFARLDLGLKRTLRRYQDAGMLSELSDPRLS